MGWRFRKSMKIAPGVRVNLSNKSTSVSVGGKGFRKTVSTSGKNTTTVSIPGTGLSHTSTTTHKKKQSTNNKHPQYSAKTYKNSGIVLQILAVTLFLLGLMLAIVTPAGFAFVALAVFLFIMGRKYKKKTAEYSDEQNETDE